MVLTIKQSDLSETTESALRVLWDARWMRKRRKTTLKHSVVNEGETCSLIWVEERWRRGGGGVEER